ncbi:MAG: YfcE family phosphodiesterase [Sedimentisphaerales bacterium]|nr:YfcE family phosphodiesterase [Sedimentisphaerales bacterium]
MSKKKQPTRITLLSDIHGNLPALEAVLDDAARAGGDEIWDLGDVLGYAPFPNEVVGKLRDIEAVGIIGNYDLKVLAFARKKDKWQRKKPPAKYAAFAWNHAHLRARAVAFLESLPEQRRRTVNGFETLLVHGSPVSIDEPLNSQMPTSRFAELAEAARADVVVFGHSHDPFVRRAGLTWFVNPGSVGRPEGGDWRASYAMLEFADDGLKVEHRRVPYDIDRVVRAVHAAGLPKEFVDVFRRAKSLDQLAEENHRPLPRRHERAPDRRLDVVLALARSCEYERAHTHQVTRLALQIFDGLKNLHRLGLRARFQLQCGALLHDIGWLEGRQGHHKTAMKRIMADPRLPFERRERTIIALVARYHRKALPQATDEYFCELSQPDQRRVEMMASILRVADGLDRSHASLVQSVRCRVSTRQIMLACRARGDLDVEIAAARKKADLMERVFGRRFVLRRLEK